MLKEGIPRHSQISHWLRKKIEEGVYPPETKLPSENELAKKFDVSRVTVRRALQSLESESVIYRCQGLGSFVSDSRTSQHLVRLTDFGEDMENAGLTASSVVKAFKTVDAPAWLAENLHVAEGDKVLRIDRLRLGDNEPIAFDSTWLPILYGQLLDKDSLHTSTIYKMLEEGYDIPMIRGCYRISATVADNKLAPELNVKTNTPLLLITRLTYTIGEKPVYYQKRYYRSDRIQYEMILERDKSNPSSAPELPFKEFAPVFRKR